jgi:hypothetical protein
MKVSERIRPVKEYAKKYAESIKTNQTIPEKWKRKLLFINRHLMKKIKEYIEAFEVLEGSRKLLEKANKEKITMEQYKAKIRYAREQKEEVEIFFMEIYKIFEQKGMKAELPDLSEILLNNERELKSALL